MKGRCKPRLVEGRLSVDGRGRAREVRELLNEERRLLRLSRRRMPLGLFCTSGVVGADIVLCVGFGGVGFCGESYSSTSDSGYAPGILRSGVLGCEFSGPRTCFAGVAGGESGGGGILVPSVREMLTGRTVRRKGLEEEVVVVVRGFEVGRGIAACSPQFDTTCVRRGMRRRKGCCRGLPCAKDETIGVAEAERCSVSGEPSGLDAVSAERGRRRWMREGVKHAHETMPGREGVVVGCLNGCSWM